MHDVTNQDMVALLNEIGEQAVVAMVERGDGEEHDPIMEMLARKVQIINAIAERVQEMTAVEYLEAKAEMCKAHAGGYGDADCLHCPAVDCRVAEKHHPSRVIEIVKRWKEEQDGH